MVKKVLYAIVIMFLMVFIVSCKRDVNDRVDIDANHVDRMILEANEKETKKIDNFIEPIEKVEEQGQTETEPSEEVEEQGQAETEPSEETEEQGKDETEPSEEVEEQGQTETEPSEEVKEQGQTETEPSEEVEEQGQTETEPSEEVEEQGQTETEPSEEVEEQGQTETEPSEETEEQGQVETNPSEETKYIYDKHGNEFELVNPYSSDSLKIVYEKNDLKVQDLHGVHPIYLGPGTTDPFVDKVIQFLSDETFKNQNDLSIIFGFGYKRGTTPDEVFNWEDVYTNQLVLKCVNSDEEIVIFEFNDLNEFKKYSLINIAPWQSTPNYQTLFNIRINMNAYFRDNSTMLILESGGEVLCKFVLIVEEENNGYNFTVSCNE